MTRLVRYIRARHLRGRRAAVTAAVFGVLLAACSDDGDGRTAASGEPVIAAGVAEGLCLARQQAADDPGAARSTFFDSAHEGIHELARSLQEVDRGAAADLLRSKQALEAALESEDAGLTVKLDDLLATTTVGLEVLGLPTPACEESE